MSRFNFSDFLLKNGQAGNDSRKFKVKDGKKTVSTFELHGQKALLAKTGAECVKLAKAQEFVEYTVNGQTIAEGKLASQSVKDWMEGKEFAGGLEKHLKSDETEPKTETAPEPVNRLNGQTEPAKS